MCLSGKTFTMEHFFLYHSWGELAANSCLFFKSFFFFYLCHMVLSSDLIFTLDQAFA